MEDLKLRYLEAKETIRLGLTVSLEDEEQMEYLFVQAQEAETEAVTE